MKPSKHHGPVRMVDLLSVVQRRKWLVAGTTVAVAVLVLIASLRTPAVYEARASLAIDRGRKPVQFEAEANDRSEYNMQYSIMNTQRDLLLSTEVLEQAIATGPLKQNPVYASDPLNALRGRVRVSTSRDTQVMNVALRDEDPKRAEVALSALIDAFIRSEKRREQFRGHDALEFLSEQVRESAARIEQARAAEQQFQAKFGILSTDPDHNYLTEELVELRSKQADLEVRLIESGTLSEQIQRAREVPERDRLEALLSIDAVARSQGVADLQRMLTDALTRQEELSQKFLDEHPRMVEVRRVVESKRGQLLQAIGLATDALEANHLNLVRQLERLGDKIGERERALADYRYNLISLQALSEQTRSLVTVHDRLLTRMGEEQVASRLDTPQVSVVDPPRAGEHPVNIKKMMLLLCSLGFGAIAGVLSPVAIDLFDRRVRGAASASDLTGVPVLAEIPFIEGLLPPTRQGDQALPLNFDEAFRALRTSLKLAQRNDHACQCLVVASASPGDGRSTVAVRLALSLAAAGHFVLLIDADMRSPNLHVQLGQSNEMGLSFILSHRGGEASVATVHSHLDFLGVGVRPPNPADMLHRRQFKRLIDDCRANYDYIILDSPPLELVSDALVLGEQADGILLVARDRATAKSSLSRSVAKLLPLGDKVVGVVLNGIATALPLEERLKYEGRDDIDLANEEMLQVNHERPFVASASRGADAHERDDDDLADDGGFGDFGDGGPRRHTNGHHGDDGSSGRGG